MAENNPNTQKDNSNPKLYPAAYVQSLLAIIEEQNKIIAELKNRIQELEAQLNQNSRNSSRPPSMDGFRRPKCQRKKGERPQGGQNGHKGHTLNWVETPDQVQAHSVTICEDCGVSLEQVDPSKVERRQVHDIPPLKVIVTEHRVEHKQCPQCGRNNRKEFPPDVRYRVQYGQNLKALMVYLCIYQLLPYDRLCETFSDLFGRSMSKATLARAVSECSHNLAEVDEKIRNLLAGAQVLNVDETGMRVNGIRQWLHVASTEILTAYGHHRKRGSKAMDDLQILPRFRGTMVHDFWAPYFRYPSRHALCNAHLLRELKGITENYHQEWSEQMYDLIQEIKGTVDEIREHSWSLDPLQVLKFEERYRQIIDTGMLENPIPEVSGNVLKRGRKKQSKAKNLLARCQKHEREILSFMYEFSVPFSNNLAERDIRMMKLQQKISGTFRSEEGADWFCRIRGYISTVKKNELPVFASLLKVFEGTPFIPSAAHWQG